MFRLEKVFQNDDVVFINFLLLLKPILVFLSIYIFSILEFNSIYDLTNSTIFKNSDFYKIAIYLSTFYFLSSFFFKIKKRYKINFLMFLQQDIAPLLTSVLITFSLLFYFKSNIDIDANFIFLLIFIIFNLFLLKKISNHVYFYLIDKNIIQRNIMLVGTPESIRVIINENLDKINVYKCCLISTSDPILINQYRLEFKIPIFSISDDIRSILEYHSLGQIWLLKNSNDNIQTLLEIIIKFSVDLLVVDLSAKSILNTENLINNKYSFTNFGISRFYGFSLFIKIFLDKIFSLFFLILLSPIFLVSLLLLYLEDGLPLFFTQDRTGWDGRRFKIFKIRSLKKDKFDTKVQVTTGDKRLLKIGSFIRRFSIDEIPQFYNVLVGDMSIVGPRPHMVEHDIFYSGHFQSFLKRHKASPGLTGWAQVSGYRGETKTIDLMKRRMDHDLWYLKNWSIWLDLYIMFKTFYIIFRKTG